MDLTGRILDIFNKIRLGPWSIKYSLWPVHIVTACCGVEFAHVFGPGFDAERHGLLPMPGLRHCNLLVVEGTITRKMAKHLRLVYEQMPDPKYVIALGSCAISGGVFSGSYHILTVDEVLPVDVYVPGCPPLPEAVLGAFVKLQEKIEKKFPREEKPQPEYKIREELFRIEKVERLSTNEKLVTLVIGPQHPGSGHFRFFLVLDGDVVKEAIPDPGYVHRGVEKLAESRHFIAVIPMLERVTLTDPANVTLCYVHALEKLLKLEVPERASYIRTILAELCRIGTHLYDFAILSIFLGHSTGYMWCFELREYICEIFVRYSGSRHAITAIIPGGVRYQLTKDVISLIRNVLEKLEKGLRSFENIFLKNAAVKARLCEVGVVTKEDAIKLGMVGPNLRASGVCYDTRKVLKYEAYPEVDFEVPVMDEGDCYARVVVRVREIEQSIKIIRQLLDKLPRGPIVNPELVQLCREFGLDVSRPGKVLQIVSRATLPRGVSCARVEGARGLFYIHLVSKGDDRLYRLRVMTPSYYNLRGMMQAMVGYRLADVPAIYGSFGHFPPECDR